MVSHLINVLYIILYLMTLTGNGATSSEIDVDCKIKQPKSDFYKTRIMKRINKEKIKKEILRKLGLADRPYIANPITRHKTCRILNNVTKTIGPAGKPNGTYYAEILEILSFSEPSDNFHDENIIQFKVVNDNQGRELEVKSANVLIKLKYRRRKKDKKRLSKRKNRRRKHGRNRIVTIILSTVDENGRPQRPPVSSLQAEIKKTNWFKLRIPHHIVEEAMHSENRILRLHIRCKGCVRGATLVLVHGSKRRKRNRRIKKARNSTRIQDGPKVRSMKPRRGKRRLSKTRPFLILHTKVQTYIRPRRSAPDCVGDGDTMCCKSEFVFSFYEVGWQDWVMSPTHFRTGVCSGLCGVESSNNGGLLETITDSNNRRQMCSATRYSPLQMTYYDRSATLVTSTLPNMIIEECGCQGQNA